MRKLLVWAVIAYSPAALAATVVQGPAGLTATRAELHIAGVPVHGVYRAELRDAAGTVVGEAGAGAAIAARFEAGDLPLHGAHLKGASVSGDAFSRVRSEPVWYHDGATLRAAVRELRYALADAEPSAEVVVTDAETGEVLVRGSLLYEHAPHGFHVYAHPDGRPLLNPFGQTWPHPTGVPDGSVPSTFASQAKKHQADATVALADPWLPAGATTTDGNAIVVFFNSVVEPDGRVEDWFGPRYGPAFNADDGDFFAHADAGGDFVFPYDPSATANEYYQWPAGILDTPPGDPGLPDPADPALNAKIVQAFYAANWLHDFLYHAGFDEAAGNAQKSNFGRGGVEGDPMIIHSGFFTTFIAITPDGDSPVMSLGINDRSMSRRDASMDFGVLAHEYGHHVIARTSGMFGFDRQQARALHEGIADFFSLLVGVSAGDDFTDAFPVGQYYNLDYKHHPALPVVGVTPDAMYYGVRRYPYSNSTARNPLTFRNLVVAPTLPFYDWKGRGPVLNQAHTAGEVFATALFQCFGELVRAAGPGADFEVVRLRMARYLITGLTMFPEQPTFIEARNAILGVMRAADAGDHAACRRGFAVRGMGAGAGGPPRDSVNLQPTFNGFGDYDEKVSVTAFWVEDDDNGTRLNVWVRNTGFVPARDVVLEVLPVHAQAVRFVTASVRTLAEIGVDEELRFSFPLEVDRRRLPRDTEDDTKVVLAYSVSAAITGAPATSGSRFDGRGTIHGPPPKSGGGMLDLLWFAVLSLAAGAVRSRRAIRCAGR